MSGELMLVNPRRKKRRAGGRKRRKMSALQQQYFGGGRKRRRSSRRRRAVPTVMAASRRVSRRRSRRIGRVRRLRRNPTFGRSMSVNSFIRDTIMPGGVGAVGALGVDLALGYGAPYLPDMLKSGFGLTAARLAGAVGVGMLAGKAMGRRFGEQATAGAVTVILYDTIKSFMKSSMPSLPLSGFGGMGWISPAIQAGDMSGLGVYVGQDRGMSGLGNMGLYVGERESDYINSY